MTDLEVLEKIDYCIGMEEKFIQSSKENIRCYSWTMDLKRHFSRNLIIHKKAKKRFEERYIKQLKKMLKEAEGK